MSKHHTHTISGTPTKLQDGSWGVRVKTQGRGLEVGDTITTKVTTKAGKSWTQTSKVIWTDHSADTTLLAKTSSKGSGQRKPRRSDSPTYVSCRDSYNSRNSQHRLACDRHNTWGCDSHLWG